MLMDIHHVETKRFEVVATKKEATPSTFRQRVIADRIVVAAMFLATIVYAIMSA